MRYAHLYLLAAIMLGWTGFAVAADGFASGRSTTPQGFLVNCPRLPFSAAQFDATISLAVGLLPCPYMAQQPAKDAA